MFKLRKGLIIENDEPTKLTFDLDNHDELKTPFWELIQDKTQMAWA